MDKVVVLGTGGHAKVVLSILEEMGQFEIVGCIGKSDSSGEVLGFKILGDDAILEKVRGDGVSKAFVAVGDNLLRKKLSDRLKSLEFSLVNAISPSAYVAKGVKLGCGIAVMPHATVNVATQVGDLVIINTNASLDHDNVVGDCAHIAPGCSLAGNVTVGEGSFLGVGTKVIPGREIGAWSIVGAGSVVIQDIPDYSVAVGVPCRPIKKREM